MQAESERDMLRGELEEARRAHSFGPSDSEDLDEMLDFPGREVPRGCGRCNRKEATYVGLLSASCGFCAIEECLSLWNYFQNDGQIIEIPVENITGFFGLHANYKINIYTTEPELQQCQYHTNVNTAQYQLRNNGDTK